MDYFHNLYKKHPSPVTGKGISCFIVMPVNDHRILYRRPELLQVVHLFNPVKSALTPLLTLGGEQHG